MAGKPLEIDWSQIRPEMEAATPPMELEVVPTPPVPSSASVFESSSLPIERVLTEVQLEEKILRLTEMIKSDIAKSLPDDGHKLHAHLQACQKELDRRKHIRIQKTDEKCETATEYEAKKHSVTLSNFLHAIPASECDLQSSFFSVFNQKLDKRATFASNSKESPMEEKRSSNKRCNSIKTSCFYAPSSGRRCSRRLKLSQGRDALISRTKKVQDVVLLDEEDVQPKDPIRYVSDDWKEAKMYYPSRDHPAAIMIYYLDLKCLEPEQYISSTIMNFYILYLQRPLSSVNENKGKYYFFNTYFFSKLEEALSSKGDRFLHFSRLRRWWKGVNIFEKAYIFLPIHKDLHWSLVIISIPPKEDEPHPVILHLDSLGLHKSSPIFEVVQCFLTEEWRYVKQNVSSPHIPLKMDKKEIKVPQQENAYDCGLFVLYFMERFIYEAPQKLGRKDLNMFGSKWFQPEAASGLRKRIQNLLFEEFESSRLEEGHDQSSSSSSEPDFQLIGQSSE